MSIRPDELAAHLLNVELPTPEVAGLLLQHANLRQPATGPTQIVMPGNTTSPKKLPWQNAATLAERTSCSDTLTGLARHTSLHVRRNVAANTNTTAETLNYLFDYGYKREDTDLLSAVVHASKFDTGRALERVIADADIESWFPVFSLAQAISGNTELERLALSCGVRRIVGAVLNAVAQRQTALNPLEAADSCTKFERKTVVAGLLESSAAIDTWTADLVDEHIDVHGAVPAADSSWLMFKRIVTNDKVCPEAWRRIHARCPHIIEHVSVQVLPPELWDEVIPLAPVNDLVRFVNYRDTELDTEQFNSLLRRVLTVSERTLEAGERPDTLSSNVLQRPDIEEDLIVDVVRRTAFDGAARWLGGQTPYNPTRAQVVDLFENPGGVFGYYIHWKSGGERSHTPAAAADMAPKLLSSNVVVRNWEDDAWVDIVVDALRGSALEAIVKLGERNHEEPLNYLARRFTREFGTNIEAWRLALNLAESSDVGLDQMCSAVRRTLSIKRPENDAPEPPDMTSDEQQGVLFTSLS